MVSSAEAKAIIFRRQQITGVHCLVRCCGCSEDKIAVHFVGRTLPKHCTALQSQMSDILLATLDSLVENLHDELLLDQEISKQ